MATAAASYRLLNGNDLSGFLAGLDEPRALLGGQPQAWTVREVGDGNLNNVFIVDGTHGSLCVKQALPYVRAAGPSWPMSPERASFENAYYRAVAPYVGEAIPKIHHFDPELYCTVMERLSPHIILRRGLIAGHRYENLARDLGEYIAHACFFTSDFARPFERKLDALALFAGNKPLIRITVELVFSDPYVLSARNRHTSPQLDQIAADFRRDGPLKAAVAGFGHKFLTVAQALVHGDLHSGSVMVTHNDSRVIDPEFAFCGPIGFDLGAFFGNLLLAWYSQPGHADANDDRIAYQDWLLEQSAKFWETFRNRFLALWSEQANGDAFAPAMFSAPADAAALHSARSAFLDSLLADMLGFGACKMIRRILGFAHVADLESIRDVHVRAECEAGALAMASAVLTHPQQFRSLEQVLDAVPRMQPKPTPRLNCRNQGHS
jgi:5-methylthioribose kinase